MRSALPRYGTLVVALALVAVMPFVADEGTTALFAEALLMLAMASLWNLLAGYVGLVSMGLQAYVGLGGYAVIFVSNRFEISPYWALPVAPIVAAAVAAITAVFLLRLRDAYFSISTWVLAEVIAMLVFIAPGLGNVTGVTLQATRDLDFDIFLRVIFWLSGGIAIASIAGTYLLMRSSLGLAMMGVRDNELAAVSIGVDVWRNRFIALVVAAAVCGLAGAINFSGAMSVNVASGFDINWVVMMIFIVIVGGIGTLEGPVLGTVVVFGLRHLLKVTLGLSGSWHLIAMGVVAVVTILVAPKGLWPAIRDRFNLEWLNVRSRAPASLTLGNMKK